MYSIHLHRDHPIVRVLMLLPYRFTPYMILPSRLGLSTDYVEIKLKV